MKRQLLGSLYLLLFLPLLLVADVKVSVDKNALYRGDSVTYTISATGSDIEFPTIQEIAGAAIAQTGSSQNIKIINGDFQKTISKSYTFTPQQSLEIPSYKVLVDGGVEHTKTIPVKIVEPSQDKSAPVVLDARVSKTKVHVGEMVRFDLVFKKKPNIPVYKLDIEEPKFEDFWVKQLDGVKEGVDGEYTTQTYSYLLFAQRSGTLKIPAVMAKVGQISKQNRRGLDPFFNSAFGQQIRYTKLFSNSVSIEAEPLPDGLELYGDFNIKVDVDQTTAQANKPVNLTVKVVGHGNIDDVQKFNLEMPGAVIYANEPTTKSGMDKEQYGGIFEQKIVIIAEENYTIPPFELHYFDPKTQKEVVKKSRPITIKVTGGAAHKRVDASSKTSNIELSKESRSSEQKTVSKTTTETWYELLVAALVGFVIGAIFVWLLFLNREERPIKTVTVTPLSKRIKKAKDDKELFELLLSYKNEGGIVAEVLSQLEENLYRGASHTIDKKAVIDFFEGSDKEIELP